MITIDKSFVLVCVNVAIAIRLHFIFILCVVCVLFMCALCMYGVYVCVVYVCVHMCMCT